MGGTVEGGKAVAEKCKRLYGADYYQKIGKIGGSRGKANGTIKGFAKNPELARKAGSLGGKVSKRPSNAEYYVKLNK